MRNRFRIFMTAAILLAAIDLCTLAAPPSACASEPRLILIELFGATYCPFSAYARCALEGLRAEFGSSTFLYVEDHVADDLEIPETLERSYYYDVSYHPKVMFDGGTPISGAFDCPTVQETYREALLGRIAETGGTSPARITGFYRIANGLVTMIGTFRLLDSVPFTSLRTCLLVYEDGVPLCCGPNGEETWPLVTRGIRDQSVTLSQAGDQVTAAAQVPLDPDWNPAGLHCIAYLQDVDTKQILQSVVLPDLAVDVEEPAHAAGGLAFREIGPNPFSQATRIVYAVPEPGAARPRGADQAAGALLRIIDPSGRCVRILTGEGRPGSHAAVWDGTDGSGRKVPGGTYYIRLEQGGQAVTGSATVVR